MRLETVYDTLVISDVHLGSPLAMARELTNLLNQIYLGVILLGDIFSDLNFSRLTSEHWQVISLIRELSNPKREIEVVWVEGNHDAGVTEVMEHLLGVPVYQQYTWGWNGNTCVAMHGHQFDALFANGNPWFNDFVTGLHIWLQKRNLLKRWLPTILDKLHTKYQRLTFKVADGAISVAKGLKADYVFCGHTHSPYHEYRDGVEYWNAGCWVGDVASYLILDENVKLVNIVRATET